jgi:hypothetical protein
VARGDDVEQRRLFAASPKRSRNVSDLTGWTFAVSLLAGEYRERQFELLAYLLFAKFHHLAGGSEPGDDLELWEFVHDTAGYRFVVNATAWSLFVAELRIDADALAAPDWLFDLALDKVPTIAPTAGELLVRYPKHFPPTDGKPLELVTPGDVADGWRRDFAALTGGGA